MECVRRRVKDVDFGYARITVRDGKGAKDRVTMLPVNLAAGLQRHFLKVKAQFEEDMESGIAGFTCRMRSIANIPTRNGPGNGNGSSRRVGFRAIREGNS